MDDTVNIHHAKTHLSRLLEQVRRGGTVTIAKAGHPIARLIPVGEGASARRVKEPRVLPEARPGSDRSARLRRMLEQEAWELLPADQAGRVLTRQEEEEILGYGSAGA
ncbi:MAG: type II toxin-antitoxin system Phd/YefM family antitoxin [bacterium]